MNTEDTYLSHYRLDRGDSIPLVNQFCELEIRDITSFAQTSSERAYPPAVSRGLAGTEQHAIWRERIVNLAGEYGFPERSAVKTSIYSSFDAELGNLLTLCLRLSPSEAGIEEVWNFLTLVLVPDVAAWRFPNKSKNPTYERWIGMPRNILRKAWWRSYCLGPELNLQIGEDEGVNLMERPTFGLNPTLARVIISEHLDRKQTVEISSSELLRVVMVRMGTFASFLNLDCLSNEQMRSLVKEAYSEAISSINDRRY